EPLGMLKAQSAALTARDEHHSHLAAPQRGLAAPACRFLLLTQADNGDGLNGMNRRRRRIGLITPIEQMSKLLQVQQVELLHEAAAFFLGEPVPPGQDVLLAMVPQTLLEIFGYGLH